MSATIQATIPDLRTELIDWRQRLEVAKSAADGVQLNSLLREVQTAIDALTRPESYGVCQVCHDLIGQPTMTADPLARTCVSCFTPHQLKELEQDLDRAWSIQGGSLPKQDLKLNGWEISFRYEPAGPVSGDYCDLVTTESGDLHFLIGDVSGKGVAASLLMSRLHAIFRSLISAGLPLRELVERANALFAETTMRPYYATLVCGKAAASGEVEICNAGHPAPLLLKNGNVTAISATGLPLGMFCEAQYSCAQVILEKGDRLVLYTDGLSEARDRSDTEYGDVRLQSVLSESSDLGAADVVTRLIDDARAFAAGVPISDDLTVMAIEMVGH
ncbi:MAG TPA: SpoIIE family protein phosphatase [Pyrinomonadaceae bacterium]|nr:SpoIIE family protein phosphatase [Pyrinomonadaceae bacterium]